MAMGAHLLSLTLESGFYYVFEALAVATGVLAILSLPVLQVNLSSRSLFLLNV